VYVRHERTFILTRKWQQDKYRKIHVPMIMCVTSTLIDIPNVQLKSLLWIFSSKWEHLAKHAGDKPYKCEVCPKQFNHKTDLRRHMCLHTGEKPFSCEVCGKGFIREDRMVKHADTHKKKPPPIIMNWKKAYLAKPNIMERMDNAKVKSWRIYICD
jgi:hypothetical protein